MNLSKTLVVLTLIFTLLFFCGRILSPTAGRTQKVMDAVRQYLADEE